MSKKRVVWQGRIEAWRDSGISAAAFCRSRGLEYSQFVYWQRVLRDKARSLVPVVIEPAASTSALVLALSLPNGIQVHVPSGFAMEEVIALVRGLSC